jgi:hypothetical protein
MEAEKELIEAVRTIKERCKNTPDSDCGIVCPLSQICEGRFIVAPCDWPDLEEGGGEDGKT